MNDSRTLTRRTGKRAVAYLALLTGMLAVNACMACDICGCFMGIVPYDNQSSISFLHRYRSFSGYAQPGQTHTMFPSATFLQQASPQLKTLLNGYSSQRILHGDPPGGTSASYSSSDYESYQAYELRARVFIHQRVELNGVLGVNHNSSQENGVQEDVSGISDLTLYAGYHAIRRVDSTVQQRLILGAGIKLPLGNYYLPDPAHRVSLLLQPGTGGVDYMAFINYIVGYKRAGASVNTMFKVNGENYYKERIANSTTGYLSLFYKIPVKNLILMPSLNAYYEYTQGLYVKDVLVPATEMNVLLAGPGLDVHYKNIGFNAMFQARAWEHTESSNLSSAARFVIGITYSFNQRSYLIKSKS